MSKTSEEAVDLSGLISCDAAEDIVSSHSRQSWYEENTLIQYPERIRKSVLPIDLEYFRMAVHVRVEPNVRVERHAHSEPILRYFISGEATLNGEKYGPGEWVLVPGGESYEIETDVGYESLMFNGPISSAPHDHIVKKR